MLNILALSMSSSRRHDVHLQYWPLSLQHIGILRCDCRPEETRRIPFLSVSYPDFRYTASEYGASWLSVRLLSSTCPNQTAQKQSGTPQTGSMPIGAIGGRVKFTPRIGTLSASTREDGSVEMCTSEYWLRLGRFKTAEGAFRRSGVLSDDGWRLEC